MMHIMKRKLLREKKYVDEDGGVVSLYQLVKEWKKKE